MRINEMDQWLIDNTFLREYEARLESATPEQLAEARSRYEGDDGNPIENMLKIEGNKATLSIRGVLSTNGPDWLDRYFGYEGTAYKHIAQAVETIRANPNIQDVESHMDTPGGTVAGLDIAAHPLKKLSEEKNVTTVNMGLIASAGYYLAVQTNRIEATSDFNQTGSIGVIISGFDRSKFLESRGIKEVKIVSKNAPNKAPSLNTEQGIEILQKEVNDTEQIFIQEVAKGRNTTEEDVKNNFGKGGLLLTQQAIEVGMIDSKTIIPHKMR